MWVCTCEICHRGTYAPVYGGQKIRVNIARMGPGLHRCHTRDLSALIDIASRDYEEVGIRGNQRVKVGHHTVLPDEAVGPVEVGVKVVSYHLASVVDAGSEGGKISRQNAEDCKCAVRLPKSGYVGGAIRAADFSSNLAQVVNDVGHIGFCASEVLKDEGSAVFPHYSVRREATVSRVAYGLALIVDPECETVWIGTYQRQRVGLAFLPQYRHFSGGRRAGGVSVS